MRVIAGALRGRRLFVPKRGVRPTADRVRESLFASLGDVTGASVLDLFAGSGALGIEALSRGAEFVVFVEKSTPSLAVLSRNLEALELQDRSRVLRRDVVQGLRRLAREGLDFDLVLADPPYASGEAERVLREVAGQGLLRPGGTLVIERGRRHPVRPVAGLALVEQREYGDTVIERLTPVEPGG